MSESVLDDYSAGIDLSQVIYDPGLRNFAFVQRSFWYWFYTHIWINILRDEVKWIKFGAAMTDDHLEAILIIAQERTSWNLKY